MRNDGREDIWPGFLSKASYAHLICSRVGSCWFTTAIVASFTASNLSLSGADERISITLMFSDYIAVELHTSTHMNTLKYTLMRVT